MLVYIVAAISASMKEVKSIRKHFTSSTTTVFTFIQKQSTHYHFATFSFSRNLVNLANKAKISRVKIQNTYANEP